MQENRLTLSGVAETHLEFKHSCDPCADPRSHDLFEFIAIDTWNDLIAFASKWGPLYYELVELGTYYDILYGEAGIPPLKGRLEKAFARWDVPRALPWEDEKRQYSVKTPDIPKLEHYHHCVELTSVWWDCIHLFRQLILLYGIAEDFVPPQSLEPVFSLQEVDAERYLVFSPCDTSAFMRKLKVIPPWWEEETFIGMGNDISYSLRSVRMEKVTENACKPDLIRRYSKKILVEVINDFFISFPRTLQINESYELQYGYLEGEGHALVSKLLEAFVLFTQQHREVGLCAQCGIPIDKSNSRGTARLYCDKPSCRVKASQKRKRFVHECKAAGGSIEYAVIQLGEEHRKSIERWWGDCSD